MAASEQEGAILVMQIDFGGFCDLKFQNSYNMR